MDGLLTNLIKNGHTMKQIKRITKSGRFAAGHNFIDLTGKSFGEWLVLKLTSKNAKGRTYFLCRCSCGKEKSVIGQNLKNGQSKNCGHDKQAKILKSIQTHGMHKTSEYGIWRGIKDRCTNPNRPEYKHYGGRGIKCCESWSESFENFYKDMGKRPSKKHSIDRIDVNGHYELSNCRWVTSLIQNLNKRPRRKLSGVRRSKSKSERYSSRIKINGKEINLGAFDTPEEAHLAYETARLKALSDAL